MKMYNKLAIALLIATLAGCTQIPEKVPKLVEVSTNAIDNQSAIAVAEWESAIAAANSAKKLLVHINPIVLSIDKDKKLSDKEIEVIEQFKTGYPVVIKQIDKVLEQKEQPKQTLEKLEQTTEAIRLANSYISKEVDENSRIEIVINEVIELTKNSDKGE